MISKEVYMELHAMRREGKSMGRLPKTSQIYAPIDTPAYSQLTL